MKTLESIHGDINILILDDEPFVLKLLGHMLTELGYTHISYFENATSALAVCDLPSDMPDLILLDINMPDIDGIEFLRHLKERRYVGSLILISGENTRTRLATEKLARAHQLVVLGSLQKPATSAGLAGLLGRWMPLAVEEPHVMRKSYDANSVRTAIIKGELINYYQPKVIVATGEVIGVETLVRWQHPEDGLVFPDCFIQVAEAHGLIGDLTRTVFKGALMQAKAWQKAGLDLNVRVNISMDDLAMLEFADFVIAETGAAGVSPHSLTLEITESCQMQELITALDVLTRLRLKGFRLSIDDFGAGHSSLAQLRNIPFDELKIDCSFTHRAGRDPELRAIFESNLYLASQLNMDVVAEGVEDAEDWLFIRSSSCYLAQGYFFARPLLAADLSVWLRDWKVRMQRENQKTSGREVL